jgi:hypothetical protein
MKHLTMGEKGLLAGDEVADLLIEYAALLATHSRGDAVQVRALGEDGDEVVATFLLNQGTALMAETTRSSLSEPDNSEAVAYLRERIQRLTSPPDAPTDSSAERIDWEHELGNL